MQDGEVDEFLLCLIEQVLLAFCDLTHLLPLAGAVPQMCSQAIVFWHARLRALSERVHLRALLRGNTPKRNRTGGRIRCALFTRATFPDS